MKDLTWMFLQVFPQKFKNDLIDCIYSVIYDQVRKDIMDYTFLSIQADESTDASTKQQLRIILRFDRKVEVVERCIKFANVGSDRTALVKCDIIRDLFNGFGESLSSYGNI